VRSETVVLSWDPPSDNGAEITEYRVRSSRGGVTACPTTTCTVTGLTNNQTYTFTVTAKNEVGTSKESGTSEEARPDEKPDPPAAPTLRFGAEQLTVTWKNRAYTDRSPIECVNLEISPAPPSGQIQKTCLDGTRVVWEGLENGTAYTVRVQARNAAPDPSEWSDPSAPETPAAPPARPAAPRATRVDTAVGGQIAVRWTAPATNGAPIKSYQLSVYRNGDMVRTMTVTDTSRTLQDLDQRSSYQFSVTATNKAGVSPASPRSAALEPYGTPAVPGTPRAALISGDTNGKARVSWGEISEFRGNGQYYQVRADGSTEKRATGSPFTFTGLANGRDHTFDVRACNDYTCSGWTARSNAVNPYTVPGRPTIEWTRDRTDDGYFTLYRASNTGGREVTRTEWVMSGDTDATGETGRSVKRISVPTGPSKSYTLRARSCNVAGCGAWLQRTGTTGSADSNRTLHTAKGGSAGGGANYLKVVVRNGEPNMTFAVHCVANGAAFYPDRFSSEGNRHYEGYDRFGTRLTLNADGDLDAEIGCSWSRSGSEVWIRTGAWGDATHINW
jgi:hypothetical protein